MQTLSCCLKWCATAAQMEGWAARGGGPCADTKTQTTLFVLCFCVLVMTSVRILRVVTWLQPPVLLCRAVGSVHRSHSYIRPWCFSEHLSYDQDPLRVQYGRTGGGGPWLLRGLLQGKFPTYQSFIAHDGLSHDTKLEMERRCPRSRDPPASKRLRLSSFARASKANGSHG